jgi:Ca-activated chloride channel homolog
MVQQGQTHHSGRCRPAVRIPAHRWVGRAPANRPVMRRIAVGLILGGLLLVGAGCSAGAPRSNHPAGGYPSGAPHAGGAPAVAGGSHRDSSASGGTDAAESPQSTFAVDVDTASYGFVRRQILAGERPDPNTVRPEEFINAFRQDYPQPTGDGFTVSVDGARLPGTQQLAPELDAASFGSANPVRLMRIGLQTRAEDPAQRPDAALTFVIDVSGSMSEHGKLDLVQDALRTLVNQLRPSDSVAIVTFNGHARVVRSMTAVRNRAALLGAIEDLSANGSTYLEAGLVTGYQVARQGFRPGDTNRVILLSDGLANVGDTRAAPIVAQIKEAAAKKIALLGVGVGSDYGDALMEQLADNGDGFVTYIWQRDQARELFVNELPATLALRALDAKVQVTFNPSVVASYRLIGYDDRVIAASSFRDDRVDGGEVGPGHTVTALYLVSLRSSDVDYGATVASARVRWLDPVTREASETSGMVTAGALDRVFGVASPRLRVAYAAGYLAEVLRGSRFGDEVRLSDLADIADAAYLETEDPQVSELAQLIRRAESG